MNKRHTTYAFAKINLTLHVLGRRSDGYHDIESLVGFAGIGDRLTIEPGPQVGLEVEGPFASKVGPPDENLIVKAALALGRRFDHMLLGKFRLYKVLPVAAGIGGGSADAAGALRLLVRLNQLGPEEPGLMEVARALGADVPVCLESKSRFMRGVGEHLGPRLHLPPLSAVLVNCGVPVPTADVFARLGLAPGQARRAAPHPAIRDGMSSGELIETLAAGRNDLEAPAIALAPEIARVLESVARLRGCRLARMSGSGATVFGLFDDARVSRAGVEELRRERPHWWSKAVTINRAPGGVRPGSPAAEPK